MPWPQDEEDDDWLDADEPVTEASDDAQRCEAPPKQGIAAPDFGPARARIAHALKWSGMPSVAVAVARDDEILWEEGFGYADPRRRRKADEHTMYSLASISKPLTATAVMVLREQGKLTLDQPIDELLPPPGLRAGVGDKAAVTVRRVASHTAGLPTHYLFYFEGDGPPRPTDAQIRERYAVTVAPPGQAYQYSNLGFGLLDHIVGHLGGGSYAEVMQREVFEPLDMKHTFVGKPPRGAGLTATRHGGSGRPLPDYQTGHHGASDIYSSAHDLVRFGMFHIGHIGPRQREILPAESRALMREAVDPAPNYGLGLGVARRDGMLRLGHSGGMIGVRTLLRMIPEQGVVIVVLLNANQDRRDTVDIVSTIEDAVGLPARADDVCALPAGHALVRRWTGTLQTLAGPRSLVLTVAANGEISVTMDQGPPATVRGVRFAKDVLSGWFMGNVGAELGGETDTMLDLQLTLREGRLEGRLATPMPWIGSSALPVVLEP